MKCLYRMILGAAMLPEQGVEKLTSIYLMAQRGATLWQVKSDELLDAKFCPQAPTTSR